MFHDLIGRPRMRRFDSCSGCGWHHSEFRNGPADVLYRWKANQLLREASIEYELAAEGDDRGRLVAVPDDARSQLVQPCPQRQPARHHRRGSAPAPATGAAAQRSRFNRMIGPLYYCLQQRKRFAEPLAFSAPPEAAESAAA